MTSSPAPAAGPRVCVLSGGALKSVAHLGMVEHFRQRGIEFDLYLGCSGGALAAVFLAAGIDPGRAFEIFRERARGVLLGTDRPRSFGFLPSWFSGFGAGLADTTPLRQIIAEYVPGDAFDGLPRGLGVNAIHLRSGAEILFTGTRTLPGGDGGPRRCSRQPVSHAVSASISLPVIFKPTLLPACGACTERMCDLPTDPREGDGWFFIDGGFRSHLPLSWAWAARPSFVLACDARLEGAARRLPVPQWSLADILHKTGDIVVRGQVEHLLAGAPAGTRVVSLSAPNWDSALFDTGTVALERSFQAGRSTARRFLQSLGLADTGQVDPADLLGCLPSTVTCFYPDEV